MVPAAGLSDKRGEEVVVLGETREWADASERSVVPDPAELAGTYTCPRLVSCHTTDISYQSQQDTQSKIKARVGYCPISSKLGHRS